MCPNGQPSQIIFYTCVKVGSCPNDDNFVQIFFCPFVCSISIILFPESVFAKKIARLCREFEFFSFVYLLRIGISILKIVLLHAHKWVTSVVILLKLFLLLS